VSATPAVPDQGSLINWDDRGPIVGYRSDAKGRETYSLDNFAFGIEQIEDSRIGAARRQVWRLSCQCPAPPLLQGPGRRQQSSENKAPTYCRLERTVIDDWRSKGGTAPLGLAFPIVTMHDHDTYDGTLSDLEVDWPSGKLDFKVNYTDGTTTDVSIRLTWDGTAMYLQDFKGLAIHRGLTSDTLSVIEYRIPRYSSVIPVPFEFRGFKSSGEEAWDKLLLTLSPADQALWAAVRADRSNRPDFGEMTKRAEAAIEKAVPDWQAVKSGKRKLTPSEEKRIDAVTQEALLGTITDWIARTNLSPEAKHRMQEHLTERMALGAIDLSSMQ
jgi:hypothetical protein